MTLRYSNREVVGGASDEYSTGGKKLANGREEFDGAIKLTNWCRLCTNVRRGYWYGHSERHKLFFNTVLLINIQRQSDNMYFLLDKFILVS